MKRCIMCNKESEGNFCVYCGEKLLEETEIKEAKEKIEKENLRKMIDTMEKEKTKTEVKIGFEQEEKSEKSNIAFCIAIVVLTIVIIAMCIYGFFKKSEYEDEISDLKSQISSLKRDYNELKSEEYSEWVEDMKNSAKIEFFDENIVFVLDGYGNYYYTYDQVQQVTQGKEYSYWAYNKEAAKAKGYKQWK